MSREDVLAALATAAGKLEPVSLRLRQRAQRESADELDELAADLVRAARGQLAPIPTAARVVDRLRQRATFLRIRARAFEAGVITAVLRELASVADADLEDTQVGIPIDDSDTFVIDDPESGG